MDMIRTKVELKLPVTGVQYSNIGVSVERGREQDEEMSYEEISALLDEQCESLVAKFHSKLDNEFKAIIESDAQEKFKKWQSKEKEKLDRAKQAIIELKGKLKAYENV